MFKAFGFLRQYAQVKGDHTVQAALVELAKVDPRGFSEADLIQHEKSLDALGLQRVDAKNAHDKEQREADAAQALFDRRVKAAEILEQEFQTETDPAKKSALEASLKTQVDLVEELAPTLTREIEEAKVAGEFFQMLDQAYTTAKDKLKNRRSELQRELAEMGIAKQQRTMAEQRAEIARQAAGLSQATDVIGSALSAIKAQTNEDRRQASALDHKTKMLAPTSPEKDDPNIARAMAAASGAPAVATDPMSRLATLKKSASQAAA